ncbi:MAG: hypothetical protein KGZ45_09840 [Clostridium sp.]|nr:hypothetical protein [Clostridium sp.]
MNSEEKILNLLEKMYIDLKGSIEKVSSEMKTGFDTVDKRLASVERTVSKIELDHGQKLGALFDGQKLNSEKLDRIEAEVIRHDELILKQIK